jgi:hypothetical protein
MTQLPAGSAIRAMVVLPLMIARVLVPERITGLAVALGAAEFPATAGTAARTSVVMAATPPAITAVRKFDPLNLFMIIPFINHVHDLDRHRRDIRPCRSIVARERLALWLIEPKSGNHLPGATQQAMRWTRTGGRR